MSELSFNEKLSCGNDAFARLIVLTGIIILIFEWLS